MRAPDFSATGLRPRVELMAPGKHQGSIEMSWSDNANPLGVYPIPALCIVGEAPGPSVLLMGGVHGDEYEGPLALMSLFRELDPAEVAGRLILLPQANAPAARAGTRCSPLDGGNLNRAFPGDAKGGPTAQIANMIAACLMPAVDAVIDLHSGGKASWFVPSALAARGQDGGLDGANMALATAFGAPATWVLPYWPGNGSVNGAASALGLPCIAAELGGAGVVGREPLAHAEAGVLRCLVHLGVLEREAPLGETPRAVELGTPGFHVTAPVTGLYQPVAAAGEEIAEGALLGLLHFPEVPMAPPMEITAGTGGFILAETRRAMVAPGDFLAFIATDIPEGA